MTFYDWLMTQRGEAGWVGDLTELVHWLDKPVVVEFLRGVETLQSLLYGYPGSEARLPFANLLGSQDRLLVAWQRYVAHESGCEPMPTPLLRLLWAVPVNTLATVCDSFDTPGLGDVLIQLSQELKANEARDTHREL